MNSKCIRFPGLMVLAGIVPIAGGPVFAAEKAVPLSTFAQLPIKEITVFKDGHAFVAHEGELPVNKEGNVVMDYLPTPVIGTFWPYAADRRARLVSVVAGQQRVLVEQTALTFAEMLEANVGAEVIISGPGTNRYSGTIAGLPARSAEELAGISPPNSPERLPEKGKLLLLKTAEGTQVIPVDRVQEITFKGRHRITGANEEFRNLLKLKMDWGRAKPAATAKMGLFYLQKGVRWIPEYKVEIDGKAEAKVKLQATLINELADLEDVSVNLVVGVPTFAFKGTIDPMALQQNLAQLSQYFQGDGVRRNSPLASQFSNAIMSQSIQASDYSPVRVEGGTLGPDIGDTGKSEDLFVFTLPHISLKRGERMVLPIAEFTCPYQDVFTLDLPFGPPPELRGNVGGEQQREMARLLNSAKVMHKVRLTNTSKYPLTTAPALIVRAGQLLGQNLMTYTAPGANVDLPITTAVDFQVKKTDLETKRLPNAVQENGSTYTRVDLGGKVTLTSYRQQPAQVEVTRYVLGTADSATHDGKIDKMNAFEDGDYTEAGEYPYWWNWYGWPYWWSYFNGVARITWKVPLEPKQPVELDYTWHYFWR